ncbi:hypothetical protein NHQ30_001789 [Ciborinia camelliae]|nr:hypothetical protein NHQ30_001789 [Ciborinia camelliae]
METIHKAVERRLNETGEKKNLKQDMFDSFLPKGLTLRQASSKLVVVLTSGVVSTSYAAQCIISCIVANPQECSILHNEIDNTVAPENVGQDSSIQDSTLNQMPFLQACISEGLRIYPLISLLREHMVPSPGVTLHGYRIPGGMFIGLNTLATQLQPVYGDHPEEFHPERWLIDDEAQLKQMHRHLELVFGDLLLSDSKVKIERREVPAKTTALAHPRQLNERRKLNSSAKMWEMLGIREFGRVREICTE